MKANVATYLRTEETWERYKNEPKRTSDKCFMCTLEGVTQVDSLQYWTIVENQFPYDSVAEEHHMLVPKRHVQHEEHLTKKEIRELTDILEDIDENDVYDCIVRNFKTGQSHPTHLHYHLIVWRRR